MRVAAVFPRCRMSDLTYSGVYLTLMRHECSEIVLPIYVVRWKRTDVRLGEIRRVVSRLKSGLSLFTDMPSPYI